MHSRLSAPIVLVHGLLGFDRVTAEPLTLARYFPGIEEALQAAGNRVCVPSLSKTRGVAQRARELRDYLRENFPNEPVHLIGHSMGGLDARYMVSRLDMHEKVLSITSVGTPHLGSTLADWGVRRLARIAGPMFRFWGISTDAFCDLTTDRCARFNEIVRDVTGVRYFSVAGRCDPRQLSPLLRPASEFVSRAEGENDGVVSVRSATHGESIDVWEADHMGLVNRRNPRVPGWRDRPADYLRLVNRLSAVGF